MICANSELQEGLNQAIRQLNDKIRKNGGLIGGPMYYFACDHAEDEAQCTYSSNGCVAKWCLASASSDIN